MADVFKLTMHSHLADGSDIQNTMFYTMVGGAVATGADWLRTAFSEDVIPQWKLATSAEMIFDAIEIFKEDGEAAVPDLYQFFGDAGAVAGNSLPANCVVRINKVADSVQGAKRGAIYLSGIPETGTDGNRLTNAYQSGVMQDLVTKLGATIQAGADAHTFIPTVRWHEWAKLANKTCAVAAGAQSAITLAPGMGAFDAAGFVFPGKVSISGPTRYRGTYDIVSVVGSTLTVDFDLPNAATVTLSFRQRLSTNYDAALLVSANPVLKTMRRRTTRHESIVA